MKLCVDCKAAQPVVNSVRCEACNEARKQIKQYKADHRICYAYTCDNPAEEGFKSCPECRERRRLMVADRRARRRKGEVIKKPPHGCASPRIQRNNLNERICLWCHESFAWHPRCRQCTVLIHDYEVSKEHGIDPRYVTTQGGSHCLRCQGLFTPENIQTEPII